MNFKEAGGLTIAVQAVRTLSRNFDALTSSSIGAVSAIVLAEDDSTEQTVEVNLDISKKLAEIHVLFFHML